MSTLWLVVGTVALVVAYVIGRIGGFSSGLRQGWHDRSRGDDD